MIDDFEGIIIADKYMIESILRDSDLGTIYRGWDVTLDKPVTVKILAQALAVDKRFVDRFLTEAKTISHAAHPNLLNVIDFGTEERGTTYTVYEPVTGETVRSLIAQDGGLSVPTALLIARQAAAGIASAHSKGVRHGALSPDKIIVSKEGELEAVKVFDFGVQPVGWNSNADIEYLSPEQYADTAQGDARSDIYSLGVILFEMLTGAVPFAGKTAKEIKVNQDSEPTPLLSASRNDLPPDLEPMVLSAISTDPEKRYRSMRSFAEDLELVSGGVAAPEKAIAASGARRNIWQTAFIVLAGMSILAVALIYATSVKKTDPTTNLQADVGYLPVQPIGPATGAQEESLAKLPAMTDAEIMAAANSNTAFPMDSLPGGDGYNPWANGGPPPIGAPPAGSIPLGGQTLMIVPNGSSQFVPPDGCENGVWDAVRNGWLCDYGSSPPSKTTSNSKTPPMNTVQGQSTPNPLPANTGVQPKPTEKPFLTPTKNNKPSSDQPAKGNPEPSTKTNKGGKPKDSKL